jgi:hypothetical protein
MYYREKWCLLGKEKKKKKSTKVEVAYEIGNIIMTLEINDKIFEEPYIVTYSFRLLSYPQKIR